MIARIVTLLALGISIGVAVGCGDDDDSGGDAGTDSDTDGDGDTDGDTDTSPDSCGGLPATCDDIGSEPEDKFNGCCWDNTVYWCGILEEEWVMQSQDCDEIDKACAYSADEGYVWCI